MFRFPPEIYKLRRLFNRTDKLKLLGLLVLMLISVMFELVGLGIIPAYVMVLSNSQKLLENPYLYFLWKWMNITETRQLFFYASVGLLLVFILKGAYLIFFRYLEARFVYNRRYQLSHQLMSAYLKSPYTFFLTRNTSELLRNVSGEINILINQVVIPILRLVREVLVSIFILVFLMVVEPFISLFALVVLGGISAGFLFIAQKRVKLYGEESLFFRKEMITLARQAFDGIKDLKVLNREDFFINLFRKVSAKTSKLQRQKAFIMQLPRPVLETVVVAGTISITVIIFFQQRPMANILPVIVLFGVAIVKLLPAVQNIIQQLTEIRFNLASVNPIHDDLMALRQATKKPLKEKDASEPLEFQSEILIRDVYFRYPNSNIYAINGVDAIIHKGSSVAFVGPSGAGKTTMVDLLLGLLTPEQGEILVDGKDIFTNVSAWQRTIGYVPQQIFLSYDTIRKNVAFGVPDKNIDDFKVLKALELAQLTEFVNSLPEGIHTMVGERGTRLSGGQRQRIGIARALYHQPQVLVMDEATSSLDNYTEQQIIHSIELLRGQFTIIMIAHRITSVMNCDTLFFMDRGKITDSGTYHELLERNQHFRKMVNETRPHTSVS